MAVNATSWAGPPLTGKKAVVTGGARGIGRELALGLAAAGAQVAVTARKRADALDTVRQIEGNGGRAHAVELDVTVRPMITSAFEAALSALGGLDVLVCNSGVGGPAKPLWGIDDQEWDEVFDVNVTGSYLCAKAALPAMIEAGQGVVLFIGSMTGKRPLRHRAPYAASKLAIVGLARTLALDAGPHGIRVNVISPGFVTGSRLDWVLERQADARGLDLESLRAETLGQTPLGRFTAASDVASTAVFLASDAAAGITGADLNVTGGLVMY